MITKLVIENLGPIEKVVVPLGRFTVLVGPNDSGKSTILHALKLLSYVAELPSASGTESGSSFPSGLRIATLVRGQDEFRKVRLAASGTIDAEHSLTQAAVEFDYDLVLTGLLNDAAISEESLTIGGRSVYPPPDSIIKAQWARGMSQLTSASGDGLHERLTVADDLFSAAFAPEPSRLVAPCGNEVDADLLSVDGFGLAAVIDQMLTSTDSALRLKIEADLRSFSPFVKSLGTRQAPGRGGKELVFALQGGAVVPASSMSNGVVLTLAFLALRYTKARKFLVEEPENGIHPRAMAEVVKVLRATASLPGGQVIMTTHSPLLLNFVDPSEALVVTRDEQHGVRVTPMIETRWFKERSADFDLGELWYNVGERELVSDAPATEAPSAS